jgi:hypothetical protein
MPFFCSIFSSFVSHQRKTVFQMATLTFRVGDHICLICFLKNHMTWFCDLWSKIFGNILKIFLISWSKILKLIFLESPAENMKKAISYFIQICLRFVSLLLFILWIIIFATVWEKSIEAFFNQELKKNISLKLDKLVNRLDYRFQFISFYLWKTIFLSMCLNFIFLVFFF